MRHEKPAKSLELSPRLPKTAVTKEVKKSKASDPEKHSQRVYATVRMKDGKDYEIFAYILLT